MPSFVITMTKDRYWVGLLESPQEHTLVVFDRKYPGEGAEVVYLFNVSRDNVVKYSKKIVRPLIKVIAAQSPSAKEAVSKYIAWLIRRKDELRTRYSQRSERHFEVHFLPISPEDYAHRHVYQAIGIDELRDVSDRMRKEYEDLGVQYSSRVYEIKLGNNSDLIEWEDVSADFP